MKNKKWHLGPFLGLLWLLLAAFPGTVAQAASVDRIVAVVNGDIITLRQVDGRVNSMIQGRLAPESARADLRRTVLEALIEQELVTQVARSRGIVISDRDVTESLDEIKGENNLTEAQLKTALSERGTTLDIFREDLRFELLKNQVLQAAVMSKIVVTDNEVLTFLNGGGPDISQSPGLSGFGGGPTNAHMGVRLIMVPYGASNKQQIHAEVRRIKSEIEDGLSFAEAAGKYSKGPGHDAGGDPGGDLTVGQLQPQLQAAAASLVPGQVSDPVDFSNAFVLLAVVKTEARSPATTSSSGESAQVGGRLDDVTVEVKETARNQLAGYKMQQRYAEWINELKSKALIKITL